MKDITHVELEFCATMFLAMLIITTLPLPLPPIRHILHYMSLIVSITQVRVFLFTRGYMYVKNKPL